MLLLRDPLLDVGLILVTSRDPQRHSAVVVHQADASVVALDALQGLVQVLPEGVVRGVVCGLHHRVVVVRSKGTAAHEHLGRLHQHGASSFASVAGYQEGNNALGMGPNYSKAVRGWPA